VTWKINASREFPSALHACCCCHGTQETTFFCTGSVFCFFEMCEWQLYVGIGKRRLFPVNAAVAFSVNLLRESFSRVLLITDGLSRVHLITLLSKSVSHRVQTCSLSNRDATYCFGPYHDQGHSPRWLVFEPRPFLMVFHVNKVTRNVFVLFILGDSLASEFYMPTFRNTLSYLHMFCSETSAYTAHMPGNHKK
jgi:hypothetical protein